MVRKFGMGFLGAILALFALAAPSCQPASHPTDMASVAVPVGFDFSMTKDVTVRVTVVDGGGNAGPGSLVTVGSTEEELAPGNMLARGITDAQGQFEEVVRVPAQHAALRVQALLDGVAQTTDAPIKKGEASLSFRLDTVQRNGQSLEKRAGDRDKDGAPDDVDDCPDDKARAFSITSAWGTLAFEDLWPNTGDYDLNDLVVRYQTTRVEDTGGYVKDLAVYGEIQARGAGIASGFGIEMPGLLLSSNNVAGATLSVNGSAPAVASPETGQTNLTWIIINNG